MRNQQYLQQIKKILQEKLNIDENKIPLNYDTHLLKNLELDSVGLLTLAVELENHFQVAIREDMANPPLTIGEMIKLLLQAKAESLGCAYQLPLTLEGMSLLDFFHEDNPSHVLFSDAKTHLKEKTYVELHQLAKKVALFLQYQDYKQEKNIGIILPTCPEFYAAFFGAQMSGHVPCALYPPLRFGKLDEWKKKTKKMLKDIDAPIILSEKRILPLLQSLKSSQEGHEYKIISLEEIFTLPEANDDIPLTHPISKRAFIQFSSGTTGDPKPLSITHRQVLYNIDSILDQFEKAGFKQDELSCMSWLPLYHDMGLVGTMLSALVVARPLTLLSPEEFIKNPQLWPLLMSKTKSCISVAPNFAFGLCAQKFKEQALDLSNWKIALCGSETVHPQTLEQFISCFSPYQFDAKALTPVYGLAEATLAVSFSPLREKTMLNTLSLGKAVKHTQIFIDKPNPEGVGEVMVLSPSTSSYPQALPTGDLGRLDEEGNLFLHGRIKDTIIIRGKNHDPALIENCALLICEKHNFPIRKGQALAFGILNESQGTEEIVLLLEAYQKIQIHQIQEIKKLLIEELALPVFEVQILPAGTLPKTSSGKFKRGEAKIAYLENSFHIPSKHIYWILLKEWTKGKIKILKGNFT